MSNTWAKIYRFFSPNKTLLTIYRFQSRRGTFFSQFLEATEGWGFCQNMTAASFCHRRPFQPFFPPWFTHSFNGNSDQNGDDENDDAEDGDDDDAEEEEEDAEDELL